MRRGIILVEGHGEVEAAPNLVARLWQNLELDQLTSWVKAIRGIGLTTENGVKKHCERLRREDCQVALLLRDCDYMGACPAKVGPRVADWIRKLDLPFPVAVVLLYQEYEVLFLPCLSSMAGRDMVTKEGIEINGLKGGVEFRGNPESVRGVKECISKKFPERDAYKPTIHQLPMTRMIDFNLIRMANPPVTSFGTLERALKFLSDTKEPGAVYP
jgi:hypothetical protein